MNDKIKGWYKRHKNLVIKEGWSKEEYDYILDNIINEKIETIDELIPNLNNKNIYDLVDLLQGELKIGNKRMNAGMRNTIIKKDKEVMRRMLEESCVSR